MCFQGGTESDQPWQTLEKISLNILNAFTIFKLKDEKVSHHFVGFGNALWGGEEKGNRQMHVLELLAGWRVSYLDSSLLSAVLRLSTCQAEHRCTICDWLPVQSWWFVIAAGANRINITSLHLKKSQYLQSIVISTSFFSIDWFLLKLMQLYGHQNSTSVTYTDH